MCFGLLIYIKTVGVMLGGPTRAALVNRLGSLISCFPFVPLSFRSDKCICDVQDHPSHNCSEKFSLDALETAGFHIDLLEVA